MNTLKELKLDKLKNIIKIIISFEVIIPSLQLNTRATEISYNENGKPMLFAKESKGIALNRDTLSLEVVDVVDGDWEAVGVIVHDVTNRSIAHMLVEMPFGPFPMALGVLYDDPKPTFEAAALAEKAAASEGKEANLAKLLGKGQTWTVDGTAQDPV